MKLIKLLEVGAEGGAITLYKIMDKVQTKYFYSLEEIDYDLEDFSTIQKRSSLENTFNSVYNALIEEYPLLYNLYPVYIHSDIKTFISSEFTKISKDNSTNYSYSSWQDKLM